MKKRKSVLEDHKKRGQVLVPPFTDALGPLQEISWRKTILPELLWIALIHRAHGDRKAVDIITILTRSIRELSLDSANKWFAPASNYSSLSSPDYEKLKTELEAKKVLSPIREALAPLIVWYPDCPLAPIAAETHAPPSKNSLPALKRDVSDFFARSARSPMMAQATAVWLAFDADILKVNADVSLARLPEIEHYPKTEISQKIGASIRATLNGLFGSAIHYQSNSLWPHYFWNRGLAIDPCEIQ
jgi:hypothetical protein